MNTNQTIKAFYAKTLFEKTKGLIGKIPSPLFFQTRFGIHTFGMKYPIDVVILDQQNIVVKFQKNLMPNNIFFWNPLYKNVLELPTGKYVLKRGERITLVLK